MRIQALNRNQVSAACLLVLTSMLMWKTELYAAGLSEAPQVSDAAREILAGESTGGSVQPYQENEHTVRCYTSELVHLWQHRHALAPSLQHQLQQRALPTSDPLPTVGVVFSERYPLAVHYRLESQLVQAQYVLELAEESWDIEVERLGFTAPIPDSGTGGTFDLDLYLATSSATGGGAYTQPTYVDEDPTDDIRSCAAYIALNESLPNELMPVYVAHELNHAMQAAMDFEEFAWAWEVSAVLIEDMVFDENNDYYGYIPYFQAAPEQSLVYFGTTSELSLYPYGAVMFMHFLREALPAVDETFVAQLWQASAQAGDTNEPDFLDAVDELSRRNGWSGLEETYTRFGIWRTFIGDEDDGHHFSEGQAWGAFEGAQVPVERTVVLTKETVTGRLSGISEYGSAYLVVDTSEAPEDSQLRVTLEGSDGLRWMVGGVRRITGQQGIDEVLTPEADEEVTGAILIDGAEKVVLVLANVGDDFDPEYVPATGAVDYELQLEDEGTSAGCQCDTGADPQGAGIHGLMLLAGVAGIRRLRDGWR